LKATGPHRIVARMKGDPLADILALAGARCVLTGSLAASGRWAVRFPPPRKLKFFALLRGACWLILDGESEPVRLHTGDVFLLPTERPFVLAGDLAAPRLDGASLFATSVNQEVRMGDGHDFFTVGGHILLHPQRGGVLAEALPSLLHVRGGSPEASTLHWLIARLREEVDVDRPGAVLASEQLAQLMFMHLLRSWLSVPGRSDVGWLKALGDEYAGPALRLMHQDPARAWQVAELARKVGMSRTRFAVHFKATTGVAPLTYLLNWRMRLARRALRDSSVSISELASSLGYAAESAFSNAFKRSTGMAPSHYRTLTGKDEEEPA
jgi:AraC-like DNA-binding protein